MLKNALAPSKANKYKKHKARMPLHERKTSLEIPIKMASVIAVAQARNCSLKEAASVLKHALQNTWIEHQREIVCTAYLEANPAFKEEEENFFQDLEYNEAELI